MRFQDSLETFLIIFLFAYRLCLSCLSLWEILIICIRREDIPKGSKGLILMSLEDISMLT